MAGVVGDRRHPTARLDRIESLARRQSGAVLDRSEDFPEDFQWCDLLMFMGGMALVCCAICVGRIILLFSLTIMERDSRGLRA